ncbi:MAG: hypothetical protein ABW069_12400 [Duganella sp.]
MAVNHAKSVANLVPDDLFAAGFKATTVAHEAGHHFGIWQGRQYNPDIDSVVLRYDLLNCGTKLNWNDVQQLLKLASLVIRPVI